MELVDPLPTPFGTVHPLIAMNRNARNPKPANHGKRPCSHKRRKRKVRERAGDHWGLPTKAPKGCDV